MEFAIAANNTDRTAKCRKFKYHPSPIVDLKLPQRKQSVDCGLSFSIKFARWHPAATSPSLPQFANPTIDTEPLIAAQPLLYPQSRISLIPAMRPVVSSCDFAGVSCRGATGAQSVKTVTEKTEGPISRNPSELLPLANMLLHPPVNFRESVEPAKIRHDQS